MGSNIVRFARMIHVISAFWILILGVIILIDVFGRALFSTPLLGATEIIKNSVCLDHIPATAAGDLLGFNVAHVDHCRRRRPDHPRKCCAPSRGCSVRCSSCF